MIPVNEEETTDTYDEDAESVAFLTEIKRKSLNQAVSEAELFETTVRKELSNSQQKENAVLEQLNKVQAERKFLEAKLQTVVTTRNALNLK